MTLRLSAFWYVCKAEHVGVCVLSTLCLLPGAGRRPSAAAQRESWFQSCELGELQLVHTHLPCGVISRLAWHLQGWGARGPACLHLCRTVWSVWTVWTVVLRYH